MYKVKRYSIGIALSVFLQLESSLCIHATYWRELGFSFDRDAQQKESKRTC